MSGEFRYGLVVGKFSPLHRGHALLINTALERCDRLAIISYASPEYPGCAAKQRKQWLESLYPDTTRLVVDEEWLLGRFPAGDLILPPDTAADTVHRTFVGRLCRDVLGITVDAVFTSEAYGDGFAAELTDFFRQQDPRAVEVRHIRVDQERRRLSISGTMIRSDPHTHRQWLEPVVYASFVRRICILGGESSGKSTLAEALARHFETVHVAEYGRELWENKRGNLVFGDMLAIAEEQAERENRAMLSAWRYLFCDTSPLTTLYYSRFMFNRSDPALDMLAERPYDLVILCAPDFAFVQDGTRQPSGFREQQHEWYLKELERRGTPFVTVAGSVSERIATVVAALTLLFSIKGQV